MSAILQSRRHPVAVPVVTVVARTAVRSGVVGVCCSCLGEDLVDLLVQPVPAAVGVDRRVRGDLGPVDRDGPQPHQPGRGRHLQDLAERRGERLLVLGPEPGDRGVVRNVLGAHHPEGDVGQTPTLDLPGRPHALAVRVDQQGQQHVRVIASRPGPTQTPTSVEGTGIQRFHRLQHEPHDMIRGQPVPHVQRQQERLITLDRTVRLGHTK
jgi:hypothetical protein